MTLAGMKLNPNITSTVVKVGREKTPVIIIDNFIADISSVVKHVNEFVDFDAEAHTYYPGVRARISSDYTAFVVATLGLQLRKPFSVPSHLKLIEDSAYYSIVTTPPSKLLAAQCRPHADTAMPHYIAVMHYLSANNHGGTGFFRHRKTGFEKITADRLAEYRDSVAESGNDNEGNYITGNTDQYELITEIGYKPNRVLVYPGCLLHSGLINPATDLDRNPLKGRLTANVFLNFVP